MAANTVLTGLNPTEAATTYIELPGVQDKDFVAVAVSGLKAATTLVVQAQMPSGEWFPVDSDTVTVNTSGDGYIKKDLRVFGLTLRVAIAANDNTIAASWTARVYSNRSRSERHY